MVRDAHRSMSLGAHGDLPAARPPGGDSNDHTHWRQTPTSAGRRATVQAAAGWQFWRWLGGLGRCQRAGWLICTSGGGHAHARQLRHGSTQFYERPDDRVERRHGHVALAALESAEVAGRDADPLRQTVLPDSRLDTPKTHRGPNPR